MNQSFWHRLPTPFFALAPMEDVTDTVFRRIVADCGRPDVMFTEFTSCEGIQSVGQAKVIHRLAYTESERPLVAQVWGITPQNYYDTAVLIRELGFDGIDINMGCPVKKVIQQGACSALIKNHDLAREIISATKAGAGNMPVSVKTRLGFEKIETDTWIRFLLEQDIEALTIHGRTVKELSLAPVHWNEIAKAAQIKKELGKSTILIGNGDVLNLKDARQKAIDYNLGGVMIGRGIFQNPWLFNPNVDPTQVTIAEKIEVLLKHIRLFEVTWDSTHKAKHFSVLKKYFKIYINGFSRAVDLRTKLMASQDTDQTLTILTEFLNTLEK